MAKSKNVGNINFLKRVSDLDNEVNYSDFEYIDDFEFICNIYPNNDLERLEIADINDPVKYKMKGLVYVFVINNKIFKIGHTINTIKDRVQSYNCGTIANKSRGTCSTTNFYVLQSFLRIGEIVKVYAFYPNQPAYILFGKTYQDSFPVAKRAENLIINAFVKTHKKKPIGCTQS